MGHFLIQERRGAVMNFWRCVCGERAVLESGMPPAACDVCEACGSTLAQHPSEHRAPEPHDPVTRYSPITGEPYTICVRCQRRLARRAP
jgi:hypothetical protein